MKRELLVRPSPSIYGTTESHFGRACMLASDPLNYAASPPPKHGNYARIRVTRRLLGLLLPTSTFRVISWVISWVISLIAQAGLTRRFTQTLTEALTLDM